MTRISNNIFLFKKSLKYLEYTLINLPRVSIQSHGPIGINNFG